MPRPSQKNRRHSAGFTFIEMLTVVFIMLVMVGVSVPVFRSSMNAVKVRSATRNVLATLTFAQEKAISSLYEHRVYFDADENAYWVERLERIDKNREKVFVPVTEAYGRKRFLPDYLRLEYVRGGGEAFGEFPFIACFPNGACGQATIRLDNTREDERITIETKGFLGKFEVERP